jgi:ribosomal protein S18 acetylase RimI-like enzyme
MPDRVATVVLRPFRPADLAFLLTIRSDLAAQHMLLAHPVPSDLMAVEAWVARREAEPGGLFRLVEAGPVEAGPVEAGSVEAGLAEGGPAEGGRMGDGAGHRAGFVQIGRVHRLDRYGYAGICLAAPARGRGLGFAAMRQLMAEAAAMGLRKLLLEVRHDNAPALALYQRLGYRDAGVLVSHYHDGDRWHDVHMLEAMLPETIGAA